MGGACCIHKISAPFHGPNFILVTNLNFDRKYFNSILDSEDSLFEMDGSITKARIKKIKEALQKVNYKYLIYDHTNKLRLYKKKIKNSKYN